MIFRMSFAGFSVNFMVHIYSLEVHHTVFTAHPTFVGSVLWLRGCEHIKQACGAHN